MVQLGRAQPYHEVNSEICCLLEMSSLIIAESRLSAKVLIITCEYSCHSANANWLKVINHTI